MRSFQGLLFIALLTLQGILVVGAPEPLTEEPLAEDASPHSAEEVQEAREEFEGIDTNKDGFITKEEILEMDEVPEKEEIEEFLSCGAAGCHLACLVLVRKSILLRVCVSTTVQNLDSKKL